MEYFFKPSALKSLRKMPREVQKRILEKLDFYCNSDNPFEFAESLSAKSLGNFRFRIGNYRIIFDSESNKIIILLIGNRKDIYKK
ncbi:type II toxin-antitoxin system RelE/ParE family toxin [Candidatus Giovannonibacteria bacterium]|nr:type II toxin-antitoxin system RelE/ParE family toxin [Candidatus Giovannonibacteria bacterium]